MRTIMSVAALSLAFLVAYANAAPVLEQVQSIPLDGVEGRIDHMAVDAITNRLYVAALGNNTVEVIDLQAGKRVDSLRGMKEPQGIVVIPDSGKVVIASGKDGKVRVYDRALKLLGTLDDLDDADNVRYDAQAKLIYVGYGDGALAVIDPEKISKVADIKLDGHPESFQLSANGPRIFVNVPSAKQIEVVDRERRTVLAKWPVKEAGANFPMALDEPNHRLFVGCRTPAKLLAFDTESGKPVALMDIVGDTDDVFYDSARKCLYASGGEGAISVIDQTGVDRYRETGKVKTAAGARTAYFTGGSGMLYLAVPHRGSQQAEIRVFKMTEPR
jgi:DNA-binding beta-propeller fold protein YncE